MKQFEKQYSDLNENARDFIINKLLHSYEIDLEHLELYHIFPSGKDYYIKTITNNYNTILATTDYRNVDLDELTTYNLCCIADELEKL